MAPKMMTYAGHAKAVLLLGLPLIGGHLAQFAIGLTDTLMLGWYGVDELAAVTLGHTYFFSTFIFGSGFALAVMPMVAAFSAEGDETSLRRVTRMGLWLSVLFCVLAIPLMLWSEPILGLLGQSEALSADAATYLRIAGWGLIPALLVMVLKSYLAALERTQFILWMTISAALANAVLNYMFIFGNWGAPEMGLAGAAWASVGTQLVSLTGSLIYAALAIPQHALFQRLWRPDWEMFAKVFRLGIPIGLTLLSETSLFGASALMMGWLGTVPLAAHGVAITLASGTFMIHLGLSNAATIRAGNAYGRRERAHMARGGIVVTVLSLLAALLTVAVFVVIREQLISLFLEPNDPDRPAILAIGVGLLAMAALFQLVDGAQVIALGLLRGVQDTGVPMIMAAFSYWVVGMPISYMLGFVFGLEGIGVWLGLVFGLAFAAALLMWRFWTYGLGKVGAPVLGTDDAMESPDT
ncbi:MAG: MATE family efflux transporter [Paracoccaceae bacterium]